MKNKKWPLLYIISTAVLIIIVVVLKYGRVYRISGLTRTIVATEEKSTTKDKLTTEEKKTTGEKQTPLGDRMGDKVVPLAAYFDARLQHHHRNATVIMVAVLHSLVKDIKGCGVDGRNESKHIMARPITVHWWIQKMHPNTHSEIILWCFDMSIESNSTVSVLFNQSNVIVNIPVKRPGVFMPAEGKEKDGVMVCCTGYGTPENLDEWLIYQQTIGVQLIHLNVDISFVQNVNKSETLKRLLNSGYVKMEVWTSYLNANQVFYYSQSFKYQDCIYRYQNIYKYMMIIDFDEYFIPLGPHKDVHFYARNLLRAKNSASAALPSIRYYCKVKGHESIPVPKDGNITILYDSAYFTKAGPFAGKAIHIVKLVEEVSVHVASHVLPNYRPVTYQSPKQAKCFIFHVTSRPFYTQKCKQ